MIWSEHRIAAWLARHTFARKCLIIVPNCSWPGNECDLLVLTKDLRVIDVEIKISRADLRADARKDKWYRGWDWKIDGPWKKDAQRRPRPWPMRVWKHYYCLPADIWRPDMLPTVASVSGVLLLTAGKYQPEQWYIRCERAARPNRQAERVTAEDAIDIARLAGLRMWDALDAVERLSSDRLAVRAA